MHLCLMLLCCVAACLAVAAGAETLAAPSSTLSVVPGTAFAAPTPAPQLAARATMTVAGRTYVVTRRITTTRRGTRAATATIDVVSELAQKTGLSKGAVAGIGLGAVALLVALGLAACWCRRRRRARRAPLMEPIDEEEHEGGEKKNEQPEPLAYTASLDAQQPATVPVAAPAGGEPVASPYPPSSAAAAFPMPSPPEPAYSAAGIMLSSSVSAPVLQRHGIFSTSAAALGPSPSTPLLRVFPAPPPPAGFASEAGDHAPACAAVGDALPVPVWPPRGSTEVRPASVAIDAHSESPTTPMPNPHEAQELGGCGPPAYVPDDAHQTAACEKHLPGVQLAAASGSSSSAAQNPSDHVA